MNQQEVFDKVVTHLRKQNKPAMQDGRCRYRGDGGTSCAVGCLIPDAAYKPDLESHGVHSWEVMSVMVDLNLGEHEHLLGRLQHAHDRWGKADGVQGSAWGPAQDFDFGRVARDYELTMPEISK